MANIILMIVCLLAGMLLRWTGRFPETTPAAFNGYVIHVALPAAALAVPAQRTLDLTMVMTPLAAWLLFLLAWGFFALLGRLLQLPRRTTGALVLLGGLGTSFVGLPMIEAYYGKELLGVGILADQLGTFMVLSTLGVLAASIYSSGTPSLHAMPRKVLYFPPFQALVLALILRPVPFPDWTVTILRKLADTVTPLALVSVGFQLRDDFTLRPQTASCCRTWLQIGPRSGSASSLLYLGYWDCGPAIQVTLFGSSQVLKR